MVQPRLPQDPINNPLALADGPVRIARLDGQHAIAGDIAPEGNVVHLDEAVAGSAGPIPARLVTVRSLLGAAFRVVPLVAGVALLVVTLVSAKRPSTFRTRLLVLLAIALVWVPVAYFPHSNIPIVLPTVRAERFLVPPAAGSMLVGAVLPSFLANARLFGIRAPGRRSWPFHAVSQDARMHALDYADDLVFGERPPVLSPRARRPTLNYGVMLGARNQLGRDWSRTVARWSLRRRGRWPTSTSPTRCAASVGPKKPGLTIATE
jgi:hypothetical protein